MPSRMSIVIPTWNGLQHLPTCLAAIMPQLPADAEVILVDNGSTDGTSAWVHQHAPTLRVLRMRQNLGFAGGVNAGMRAARRGDDILLINDDAFAEPGFIAALQAAARAAPHAGAIAGVLTFAHRPQIVAAAGIRARRDGVALDLWTGQSVAELPDSIQPIMGASGGAALLRRAMIDDIGLLEGRFFNYLEDVDLAWRALLRGWETIIAPQARARHVYSATAGQGSPFKQRLLGRNRIAAIVRCFPGPLLVRCLMAIVRYDALAILYAAATGQHAIIAGRMEAFRHISAYLEQRRSIQAHRTAPIESFAKWLEPAPLPWVTLAEQQRLEAILAERTITSI
ncbi:MAG: glycosyltransferase family 2 protein [Roseiflexaceae bacterium]|nr:glycosyltransferase family 2 protein [Roseiflexaceae bacterium]